MAAQAAASEGPFRLYSRTFLVHRATHHRVIVHQILELIPRQGAWSSKERGWLLTPRVASRPTPNSCSPLPMFAWRAVPIGIVEQECPGRRDHLIA